MNRTANKTIYKHHSINEYMNRIHITNCFIQCSIMTPDSEKMGEKGDDHL